MTNTLHPVSPEEVMAYLDGELRDARAVEIMQHLDSCSECRTLVRDFQAVSRRMAEWEVGACRIEPVPGQSLRRWRWKPSRGAIVAFAACLGALIIVTSRPYRSVLERLHTTPLPGKIYNTESNFVPSPRSGHSGYGYDAGFSVTSTQADTSSQTRADGGLGTRLKAVFSGQPMIAHLAQIIITSTDFGLARERMESILKAHNGYLGQLTVNSPSNAGRSLEADLKVPSSELSSTLTDLKKLGRVETESQSGEEVSQQYVDLEDRLANARNAEERLIAVLRQRTGKMEDILAVENEITRVRGEIETMESDRKALGKRVSYATINLRIGEEYKAPLEGQASIGTRLGNAAVAGYRHVTDGAMSVAEFVLEYALTFAFGLAILFWPARQLWRRFRNQANG